MPGLAIIPQDGPAPIDDDMTGDFDVTLVQMNEDVDDTQLKNLVCDEESSS